MLENAVAPIEELRQVKNNADMEKTKTGVVLSYENYASLLLSAATSYDNQHKTNRRSKRQVYLHDLYDDFDMDQNEDEEYNNDYDIDIPVATLQANVHDSKTKKKMSSKPFPQRPRMSRDKWFSLSETQKLIWDQLDDKAKAIILGISKPQPQSSSPQRQVNLHEISVFDFLQANAHQLEQIPELDSELNDEDTEEFQNAQQDSEPDTLTDSVLVHAAKSKSNKLQPGDIRRVMSKTSKRSVNLTHVVYSVSAHKSSTPHSLVDRGANGGVAGDDV
jgi:hypothetical protein